MILADTSVWIEHFRVGHAHLSHLLASNAVVAHPVVIGELATGNLRQREAILEMLLRLPRAKTATFEECLAAITTHRLFGRGVGWMDVQLLLAASLSHIPLWSLDRRLRDAAEDMGVAYLEAEHG